MPIKQKKGALLDTLKFGIRLVEEMAENKDSGGMEELFEALKVLKGLKVLREL